MGNQEITHDKSQQEEKIVPLHEDMHGHEHDDASYQKAMTEQENIRKEINKE